MEFDSVCYNKVIDENVIRGRIIPKTSQFWILKFLFIDLFILSVKLLCNKNTPQFII